MTLDPFQLPYRREGDWPIRCPYCRQEKLCTEAMLVQIHPNPRILRGLHVTRATVRVPWIAMLTP